MTNRSVKTVSAAKTFSAGLKPAAIVALAIAGTALSAAPAAAQFYGGGGWFGGWRQVPMDQPMYERGGRVVPPRVIAGILRQQGFSLAGHPYRQGDRIIATGVDERGQSERFVIDAYDGTILNTAYVGAPRPPGFIGTPPRSYAYGAEPREEIDRDEQGETGNGPRVIPGPIPAPSIIKPKPKLHPRTAARTPAPLPKAFPASPAPAPSQATKAPGPVVKPVEAVRPAETAKPEDAPVAARPAPDAQPTDIGPNVRPVPPSEARAPSTPVTEPSAITTPGAPATETPKASPPSPANAPAEPSPAP